MGIDNQKELIMQFRRNLPNWERALRAGGGIAALIAAFAVPMPTSVIAGFAIAGAILLVTAAAGFCPLCALAGRRLPE